MSTTLLEYLDLEIDTLQELLSLIPFKPSAEDTIGTPTLGGISVHTQISEEESLGQDGLQFNGAGNSHGNNKHEEKIFMNLYKLRRDELVNILNNGENSMGIDSNKMLKLGISLGNLIKNSQIDEQLGIRVVTQPPSVGNLAPASYNSNTGNSFMNRLQSLGNENGSALTLSGNGSNPTHDVDNPFVSKQGSVTLNKSIVQQTVQQVKFLRNLLTLLKNFDVGSSSLYQKRSSNPTHANGSTGGHRGVSTSSILSGNSANNGGNGMPNGGGFNRGSEMYNYDGTNYDTHSGMGGHVSSNRDSATSGTYGAPTGSGSVNGSTHTGGLTTSSMNSSSPIKLTSKQLLIEKLEININLDLLFIYQILLKLILRIYEIMRLGILQHQGHQGLERSTLNNSTEMAKPPTFAGDFNFSMNMTMNNATNANDSSSIFSSNSATSSDTSSICTPDEYVRLVRQVTDRISYGIIGPFVNIIVTEIVEPNINQGLHDVMVSL